MMNEINIKKMNELVENEEFAQKILAAGSCENAYKLFVENGVDASYEDFAAHIEESRKVMVEKGLISEDGELSVEMLEAVSGGGKGASVFLWVCAGVAFGVGCAGLGAIFVVAGMGAWSSK